MIFKNFEFELVTVIYKKRDHRNSEKTMSKVHLRMEYQFPSSRDGIKEQKKLEFILQYSLTFATETDPNSPQWWSGVSLTLFVMFAFASKAMKLYESLRSWRIHCRKDNDFDTACRIEFRREMKQRVVERTFISCELTSKPSSKSISAIEGRSSLIASSMTLKSPSYSASFKRLTWNSSVSLSCANLSKKLK